PAFLNLLAIAHSIALSKSASSNTRKGACPPNSIDIFFTVSADWRINSLPTSVDPVNVNLRTLGLAVISPTTSLALPIIKLTTPLGNAAWSNAFITSIAERGVAEAGFTTTGHPAARAGAIFLVIIATGKFHGVTAATTPTGCFITINLLSSWDAGNISPYTLFASSAYQSR